MMDPEFLISTFGKIKELYADILADDDEDDEDNEDNEWACLFSVL